MPMQDLAYRFGISLPTVSRIFLAWMVVLDVRLAPLMKWPDREDLNASSFPLGTKLQSSSTALKCLLRDLQISWPEHKLIQTIRVITLSKFWLE